MKNTTTKTKKCIVIDSPKAIIQAKKAGVTLEGWSKMSDFYAAIKAAMKKERTLLLEEVEAEDIARLKETATEKIEEYASSLEEALAVKETLMGNQKELKALDAQLGRKIKKLQEKRKAVKQELKVLVAEKRTAQVEVTMCRMQATEARRFKRELGYLA